MAEIKTVRTLTVRQYEKVGINVVKEFLDGASRGSVSFTFTPGSNDLRESSFGGEVTMTVTS